MVLGLATTAPRGPPCLAAKQGGIAIPKIVAVANLKGGCGKTTLAVNLACELLSQRTSVAVVDADGQGSATYWAEEGELPVTVVSLPLGNRRGAESWIAHVLSLTDDIAVIDCPPQIGAATEAAVGIADLVLVPVTPSVADLAATAAALELVNGATEARQDGGPGCLLIPSKVDARTNAGRGIEEVLRGLEEAVAPAVGQRTAFVDSFGAGHWIGHYSPRSKAYADIKALAKVVRRFMR